MELAIMIVRACIFTFFSFIFQESLAEARVGGGLMHSQNNWVQQYMHGTCWRRCHYLHYLHHSLASGQTTGKEHSPTHQKKTGLKIYWVWPRPSEQDPVSPSVSLSHQEVSISLLSLSIRGQADWKLQSQKTNQTDHMDHRLVNEIMSEPCHEVPSKTDGLCWNILTKHGLLQKGMANHFSILALRTPWTVWKGKKIGHWKMNSPGQ